MERGRALIPAALAILTSGSIGALLFGAGSAEVRTVAAVLGVVAVTALGTISARRSRQDRAHSPAATTASSVPAEDVLMTVHEIRTPVAAIGLSARSLARDLSGRAAATKAEAISQASDRILGLLEDIADMSLLESGRSRANLKAADLDDLAADALRGLRIVDHPLVTRGTDVPVPVPRRLAPAEAGDREPRGQRGEVLARRDSDRDQHRPG